MSELQGSVAVVTGATRNIGRSIAEALAEAGASVAVCGYSNRQAAAAISASLQSAERRAVGLVFDVRDRDAVVRAMNEVHKSLGPVDILVNCAAVREEQPLEAITSESWRAVLGIVLDGAFNMIQAALPDLRCSGRAAIVNIGGETGHTGAPHRAHVVAAKAGLAGLTKAVALDLAAEGITCNCVVPGAMDTQDSAMTRHSGVLFAGKRLPPVGRRGQPWEVAAMVRMLCGPGARYITGQSIHVNGGFSCH